MLWGLLLMGTHVAAAAPILSTNVDGLVKRSLVRIEADCPSSDGKGVARRISQGFVYAGDGRILTVRHGIVGCTRIRVQLFGGKDYLKRIHESKAHVVTLLKGADLAIVQLEEMPPKADWPPPLDVHQQGTPAGADVFIISRFYDAPLPLAMPIDVLQGNNKLESLVDDKTRQQLESTKSPSLELEIVTLHGFLRPGVSGAPVVNLDGKVVAIADGGLGGTMSMLNWGIPASAVAQLLTSSEKEMDVEQGKAAGALFSTETKILETTRPPPIKCGDREFILLRTVGVAELRETADDRTGIAKVLRHASFDAAQAQFDVYQDTRSGAAIAVPAGGQLESLEDGCYAQLDEGGNILVLLMARTISRSEDAAHFEEEYGEFMAAITQDVPWTVVPEFTTDLSQRQEDGLLVGRQMAVREVSVMDDQGAPHDNNQIWFQTMVARGDTIVAYSVLVKRPGESTLSEEWGCLLNDEAAQACNQQVSLEDLALAAVQLTTFPLSSKSND